MHSAQYKYNVHVWEAKRLKVSKKKKDNLCVIVVLCHFQQYYNIKYKIDIHVILVIIFFYKKFKVYGR